jgi:hypothetical protein
MELLSVLRECSDFSSLGAVQASIPVFCVGRIGETFLVPENSFDFSVAVAVVVINADGVAE